MEQNNIYTEQRSLQQDTDQEIDLVEIIRKLWKNRKFILRVTLGFMVLGVLVALLSSEEYTAGSTMVPQTSEKSMGGGLSGLAAMAGINLGDVGGGEALSPKMYSKILESIPFQKELMQTPIKFEEYEQPVTLFDYFTNEDYKKFTLGGAIKKYTIGLPGVIIKAIRGEKKDEIYKPEAIGALQTLTIKEKKCVESLKRLVTLNLNEKDGYVELTAVMPEPLAAAQLAERVQTLLQRYITEFKIEKVQSNLDFVQERFDEVKHDFEQIQQERAVFKDANKNIYSARAQTQEEQLDTRYNLALSVYSELAKQVEQAKIQVKETTPILTIIDPVTIPLERSKPKRVLILVLFTFLGGFAGVGLVLILPSLANILDNEKLRNVIAE